MSELEPAVPVAVRTPSPVGEKPAILCGYLAAVLLLPILALWSQDNALFTGYGYTDPWVYFGYFHNLTEFKRSLFVGDSHGDHLAWILPGAALHALLDTINATRVLHLGVHTLATTCLFLTLQWTAGIRRALVSAMVFCTNPWVWAATGWDYVDGAAIAYCLLAMTILTWAATRPTRQWPLLAAGIAVAAMLNTVADWLTLSPLLPLYYAGLMRMWHRVSYPRSLVFLLVWFGSGCFIATTAFSVCNDLLDHRGIQLNLLYVFLPKGNSRLCLGLMIALIGAAAVFELRTPRNKRAARKPVMLLLLGLCGGAWIVLTELVRTNTPGTVWWRGLWQDAALSPWLWFPMIAVATAAVVLYSELRSSSGISSSGLFSLQLLCAFGWMSYSQLRGRPELGQFYYASKLLPISFLVIGARFWPEIERVRFRDYLLFCSILGAVLSYAWLSEGVGLATALQYGPWFAAAALLATLFWRRFPEYLLLTAGAFFVFSALGVGSRYGGLQAHALRDQLQSLAAARGRIETVRQGKAVHFWYDETDAAAPDAVALTATYLGNRSVLSRSFATAPCSQPLPASILVATISAMPAQEPDFFARAVSTCRSGQSTRLRFVETDSFANGRGRFQMSLFLVESTP